MPTKRKRIGRPPLPKGGAKEIVVQVRLQAREKEALESAARRDDLTVSAWVRRAVQTALRVVK